MDRAESTVCICIVRLVFILCLSHTYRHPAVTKGGLTRAGSGAPGSHTDANSLEQLYTALASQVEATVTLEGVLRRLQRDMNILEAEKKEGRGPV